MAKKKILIAPLNWGLGHASRCIPIILELMKEGFEPVIASDGHALHLLQKEFPDLESHELPSYNIRYSSRGIFFRWKIFKNTPHILRTISAEKKVTEQLVKSRNISGIISDNRWGVRSHEVPSAFITHQINVPSGFTTFFSSKIQQNYIKKFDECWVPDVAAEPSLSGKLSNSEAFDFPVKYLGILSRFKKKETEEKWEIAVLLSGPEPQRQILENILFRELKNSPHQILFVKGVVERRQEVRIENNFTIYNFLLSTELEKFLNSSKIVLCRPGYTSLMDLAALEKKVFVIPTTGQYEQEYLAGRLKRHNLAASCTQNNFKEAKLSEVSHTKGLGGFCLSTGFRNAFALFKSK